MLRLADKMTPMPSQDETLHTAFSWMGQGNPVVLATVVETWGSAPCPVGSHLAVREDGHFLGSVSGGCIEGDVITRALELMEGGSGNVRLLNYEVANKTAWQVGLACGGKMSVFLENLSPRFGGLDEHLENRRPLVRAVHLEDGHAHFFHPEEDGDDSPLAQAARQAWQEGHSGIREIDGARWFLQLYLPPLRLIIVGAVHIAQSLHSLATLAGVNVILIDPREAFASQERFSGADLRCEWPEDAFDALGLDSRCAVVVLTHDPKLDDPALQKALSSSCFYIAALGSRKTHAARLDRLRAAGVGEDALARIHGPAGLDIGAISPEEIAVSILAQMVEQSHR